MALTIDQLEAKVDKIEKKVNLMDRRPESLTGMLPASIKAIGALMKQLQALGPTIMRGFDADASKDSFHYWGCAVDIECSDYAKLHNVAEPLGFTWGDKTCAHPGHLELAKGIDISIFKLYKVDGDLEIRSVAPVEKPVAPITPVK